MNQTIFVTFCLLVLVLACLIQCGPIKETELRSAMSSAFLNGLAKFSSLSEGTPHSEYPDEVTSETKNTNTKKTKIFSQYTANLKALGGGKPRLTEQYRHHNYTPLAPSVIPYDRPIVLNNKLTPGVAAKLYVPRRPLQFSTDIQ